MKRKIYSGELNFVTLTVVGWINVFTRRIYKDFIIDNLAYCRQEKGLLIYAYVLMTNHLHLVIDTNRDLVPNILRDFKTFTSKKIVKMIKENPQESRKAWMIDSFKRYGANNNLNINHQFWRNGNYPVGLYSNKVIQQKIDYIQSNPVKAGFVSKPENYYYSSANPENPLELDR